MHNEHLGWQNGNMRACLTGKQIGDKGYYIEPTMFGNVEDSMQIAQDEIFGPVLCCMRWKTIDEVCTSASIVMFGLLYESCGCGLPSQ